MRKTERIIRAGLCVSILVMLLLCVTGCKKETYDFPEDLAAQLPETTIYNIHKFVLDERLGYNSPFVRWRLNGQDLFMMVDSGCYDNYLLWNGINKAFPKFVINETFEKAESEFSVQMEKNKYVLDPYGIVSAGFIPDYFDGFLGLTWMKQYNNIVIDYVNNRIDYNQPPITDYDIPMNWNDIFGYKYAIPFTFNGKEMYGMLDTGCYCTMVNLGIIGEEKNENGLYIVHDFSIGNVKYESMEIKCIDEVLSNESMMIAFAKQNTLGYPCFKDHVIQLDFKNNVFRIK